MWVLRLQTGDPVGVVSGTLNAAALEIKAHAIDAGGSAGGDRRPPHPSAVVDRPVAQGEGDRCTACSMTGRRSLLC